MERIYQTPRDHLRLQSRDSPPQKLASKQVHTAAIAKASKKWDNGREDEYMNRQVLMRERLAAATRYESKAFKRPVNLYLLAYIGCTARKYFNANISAAHVTIDR